MHKVSILVLLVLFGTAILAETDNVAKNLRFLVAPISETPEDFIGAEKVCNCVAIWAFKNWSNSRYRNFAQELHVHVEQITKVTENIKSTQDIHLPSDSKSLNTDLSSLVGIVRNCEEKFRTKVEF